MAINKGGRKRLGDKKREHARTLRFNGTELEKVKTILQSYNLDFGKGERSAHSEKACFEQRNG